MSTIGLLITIGAIITAYLQFAEKFNLKKGGVYSRIQARRSIMDDCDHCSDDHSYEPPHSPIKRSLSFKEA